MIGVFISHPTALCLNFSVDTLQFPLVKNPGIVNNSEGDSKELPLLNSFENMVFLQKRCKKVAGGELCEETQKG